MTGVALLTAGLGALGLAIALAVIAVGPRRTGQPGVAGGLVAIEKTYAISSAESGDRARSSGSLVLPAWLRALAIRLSPAGIGDTLQHRLDLAGNPLGWTADRILAVKGLALLVFAMIGTIYGVHSVAVLLLATIAGGVIGFYLPDLLLYNAGLKRQDKILHALPEALDMLTVCVEAGLGFDAALAQVARNTRGPLAAEFARALQEMQIGLASHQALRGMVARTSVAELKAFVSALVQAGELGIPVAQVLREQAGELRLRRRQRAEERAQQVPVKIMIPLILCLFPALLVIVIGPGILSIMHSLLGR